jgi:hypothetical protein
MLFSECREDWSASPGALLFFYRPDWPRRGAVVATSDEVQQIALDLAKRGVETDPAVRELGSAVSATTVSPSCALARR